MWKTLNPTFFALRLPVFLTFTFTTAHLLYWPHRVERLRWLMDMKSVCTLEMAKKE